MTVLVADAGPILHLHEATALHLLGQIGRVTIRRFEGLPRS